MAADDGRRHSLPAGPSAARPRRRRAPVRGRRDGPVRIPRPGVAVGERVSERLGRARGRRAEPVDRLAGEGRRPWTVHVQGGDSRARGRARGADAVSEGPAGDRIHGGRRRRTGLPRSTPLLAGPDRGVRRARCVARQPAADRVRRPVLPLRRLHRPVGKHHADVRVHHRRGRDRGLWRGSGSASRRIGGGRSNGC